MGNMNKHFIYKEPLYYKKIQTPKAQTRMQKHRTGTVEILPSKLEKGEMQSRIKSQLGF